MLRIQRIGRISTFKAHYDELNKLVEKYRKKAEAEAEQKDIIDTFKLACNNPDFFNCIIFDENKAIGFFISFMQPTFGRKVAIIDCFYCPNKYSVIVFAKLFEWIENNWKVKKNDVHFMTYRNAEAFIRLAKRHGFNMEIKGYVLKVKEE